MKSRRCLLPDLRARLETARLDLLALFRALDQLNLTANEIPQPELQNLFELDADFAEALYVLRHLLHGINVEAMVRDTVASLDAVPEAREKLLQLLPPPSCRALGALEKKIRLTLTTQDAYHSIPESDPQNC